MMQNDPKMRPHTSLWFDYMLIYHSQQAMHTLAVLAACDGNLSVCGVCGDENNVHDYLFANEGLAMRWCVDCWNIQADMSGNRGILMLGS